MKEVTSTIVITVLNISKLGKSKLLIIQSKKGYKLNHSRIFLNNNMKFMFKLRFNDQKKIQNKQQLWQSAIK